MKELSALNKYFWKYRVRLGAGIFFVLLSNYFNVLSPQITSFIIDFVQKNLQLKGYHATEGQKGYAWVVSKFTEFLSGGHFLIWQVVAIAGFVIILLALLRGFFLFLMRQTLIVMSRHIEFDQKNEIFSQYQKLDIAFFKSHRTGDLMNRIAEDVSRVRSYTGPAIMYQANLITVISLSVFFMVKRDAELTLYVLAPLPILAIAIYLINDIINKRSEKIQESLSSLTTEAQETYSGIRVIKSFVQEKDMLKHFTSAAASYKKDVLGLVKVESLYFPSISLLIGISTLITIMIGGLYYINGKHGIGIDTIVEFVMYINMLTFPVSAIGLTASMMQRAAASQKRINEFLAIEPDILDKSFAIDKQLAGAIQFENISFTYPDTGIKALVDFNLNIVSGEKVAIFGATGSGKTTIAQLLLKLYKPSSGKILVDNLEIDYIKTASLRSQISYVPQDVFLFSDTVANNISFGKTAVGKETIEGAAKMACIHAEIENFPLKYDTQIGERGVTLSGGQKQRISIARSLLKNPAILIFDDCLSAVDANTEQQISSNLNAFLAEKTAIVITHRILSGMKFDRVVVLDEGRIVEQGNPLKLLEKGGAYAAIWKRQQEKDSNLEGS
jgi:ATP-binding cassette subfamily B protein